MGFVSRMQCRSCASGKSSVFRIEVIHAPNNMGLTRFGGHMESYEAACSKATGLR